MKMANDQVIRVAIADDHMMFRRGIAELLNHAPTFEVVAEAGNGRELIDMIGRLSDQPDVCLLDINMPVQDGHQTLVVLKEKYPMIKCLALTMYDQEFIIIRMLRNGINGYLLKENDPEELKRAIRFVLEHDFYHSELVSSRLISVLKQGKYNELNLNYNEQRFLELCCTELIYKEIATRMGLSVRTVEGYRDDLFQRLGVKTRTGLVMYALKNGIVSL